jgi:hypothetical protein
MLGTPELFDYNPIIIVTTTPSQPIYQLLWHGFNYKLSKEELTAVLFEQENFEDDTIPEICMKVSNSRASSSSSSSNSTVYQYN